MQFAKMIRFITCNKYLSRNLDLFQIILKNLGTQLCTQIQLGNVRDDTFRQDRFNEKFVICLHDHLIQVFLKTIGQPQPFPTLPIQNLRNILDRQCMYEGLGGKIDMELTVTTEVKVGPYRFRNVPTYIFDDENNK